MREIIENLEKEINSLMERMTKLDPSNEEYETVIKSYVKLVEQLETLKTQVREDERLKLNEIQSEADRNSREWVEEKKAKTGIIVAGIGAVASTAQVLGICFKENIGIVASKAFNFVFKRS